MMCALCRCRRSAGRARGCHCALVRLIRIRRNRPERLSQPRKGTIVPTQLPTDTQRTHLLLQSSTSIVVESQYELSSTTAPDPSRRRRRTKYVRPAPSVLAMSAAVGSCSDAATASAATASGAGADVDETCVPLGRKISAATVKPAVTADT